VYAVARAARRCACFERCAVRSITHDCEPHVRYARDGIDRKFEMLLFCNASSCAPSVARASLERRPPAKRATSIELGTTAIGTRTPISRKRCCIARVGTITVSVRFANARVNAVIAARATRGSNGA
jgi:hypothetical protein